MADSEIVKDAEGFSGEPAELRVVSLPFQLPYDDEGEHDIVLREPQQRTGIR